MPSTENPPLHQLHQLLCHFLSLSHTPTPLGTTKEHGSLCSNWNNLWHFAMRQNCATQNLLKTLPSFSCQSYAGLAIMEDFNGFWKTCLVQKLFPVKSSLLYLLFSLWYFLLWRESRKFYFNSYQNNLTKISKNGLHLSKRKTSTTRWMLKSKILGHKLSQAALQKEQTSKK